jgi:hypothetical protein
MRAQSRFDYRDRRSMRAVLKNILLLGLGISSRDRAGLDRVTAPRAG